MIFLSVLASPKVVSFQKWIPLIGQRGSIIAFIDDTDVIERILKHLNVWDPPPNTLTPTVPDPPLTQGETLPLTYHALPDIA